MASDDSEINSKKVGMDWKDWDLQTILGKNITIPSYQRPYAWEFDQIDDFIKDLDYFIKSGYPSYLFGQAILMQLGNKSDKYELIDGQQRLTTAVIFLSAIRDITAEYNLPDVDSFRGYIKPLIGKQLFGNENYNLTLGKDNRDYFIENIQRHCVPENANDGLKRELSETDDPYNKKIYAAYTQIYNDLIERISNKDTEEQKNILYSYMTNLCEHFKLSVVITDDIGQAYIIFETLNKRGTPLDVTDLLKNFFFMRCNGKSSVVENWNKLIDNLVSSGENPSDYIRCYWNSIHSFTKDDFTREKYLFRNIKSARGDRQSKAENMVKALLDQHKTYLALRNPDRQKVFTDAEQKKSLRCLRQFTLKTFYPVMLALKMRNDLSESTITKCISVIESYIVRNMVIGKDNPNAFETDFAAWASRISKDVDVNTIIKEISDKINPDSEFKMYFCNYSNDKNTKPKVILWNIYNHEYKERLITDSPSKIHLEHIMPEDNGLWKTDEAVHKKCCYRLGNMTLLYGKLNQSIKHKLLENKCDKYEESDIKQNAPLLNYTTATWTEEIIASRQEYLFSIAIERWPVDKAKKDVELDLENNPWYTAVTQSDPTKNSKVPVQIHSNLDSFTDEE